MNLPTPCLRHVIGTRTMTNHILPERAAPAFSFYPNDFTSGTRTMSLAECGAYVRLLCHQWDTGSVPDDPIERSRILGCSQREADKIWSRVSPKFEQGEDGHWRNLRLEGERDKQAERRAALSVNGHLGAERRWGQKPKHGQANGQAIATPMANGWQTDGLSSSSSSSKKTLSEKARESSSHSRENTEQIRAGEFCEWYADTHSRIVGVGYIGNPRKDYETALMLVGKFTDSELRDASIVWFGQRDNFATSGTRTVTKFASRASALVVAAREVAL